MEGKRRHTLGSTGFKKKFHNFSSIQDKESFIRQRLYSDPGDRQLIRKPSCLGMPPQVFDQRIAPTDQTYMTHEFPCVLKDELPCVGEDDPIKFSIPVPTGLHGSVEKELDNLLLSTSPKSPVRRRATSEIVRHRSADQRLSESETVVSVFSRLRMNPRLYARHRYADAIQTVIPKVFHKIFFYKYQGSPSLSIEEHLTQCLGYSQRKVKSVFGSNLKLKLKVALCKLPNNDVSLWYKLLKVGCDLASPDSSVLYNSTNLEHILCELKEMRNSLVHGDINDLSPEEYISHLQELRELCLSAIEAASDGSEDLNDFKEILKNDIGQYELDIAQVELSVNKYP